MVNGFWCECCDSKKRRSQALVKHKKIIEKNNGKTIRTSVKPFISYILFCDQNHEFKIKGCELLKKRWCPQCSRGLYERIIWITLTSLFRLPFNKVNPDFLMNEKTGFRLQYDFFNENLALAFEFDGNQHKEYDPFFHKSKDVFLKQKERDILKDNLSKKAGITLIRISQDEFLKLHRFRDDSNPTNLPQASDDLVKLIVTKLKESEFQPIPENWETIKVDISPAFSRTKALKSPNRIKRSVHSYWKTKTPA
jgi:hypothetical protein